MSRQCWLPNSRKLRPGAHLGAVGQWKLAPLLLQDLPPKMSHRLLRSVTWTEVDAVSLAGVPFRTLTGRVAWLGRRLATLSAAIPWTRRHS
jgi:hypothetical protein